MKILKVKIIKYNILQTLKEIMMKIIDFVFPYLILFIFYNNIK